ncbi:hypothetical protein HER31_11040 [Ferrimonas lipolytica]|uniref:Uncharacterized protein n=1 Tax=Ferrimonas lipolytica TaxID=2724191 RepID=A0A6H1UE31_9GAMM|nr:hypothetical protein HER31_11040 [Ferrimonas lipolytica]
MAVLYLFDTTPAEWDDALFASALTPLAQYQRLSTFIGLLIGSAPLHKYVLLGLLLSG